MKRKLKRLTKEEKRAWCKQFVHCFGYDENGNWKPICPFSLDNEICKFDYRYIAEHGDEEVEI